MTIDKITHHIGQNLTSFIASLNIEQLTKMKADILQDMNLHKLGTEILFKRTIELEFINQRLKTNL